MVIHTKEKANEMDKKASAKLMFQKSAGGKSTYRKSTIHQSEAKDKGLSRFKRNIRESGTSIKTKNTNLHIAGRTAYNYNTLEPKLLKVNGLDKLNRIFGTDYTDEDGLRKYMKHNKTECALRIFESSEQIEIPEYIVEAIRW